MSQPIAVGTRLGRLTLLAYVEPSRFVRDRKPHGLWQCECGKQKRIALYSVTSGRTRSCGCGAQQAVRGWLTAHRRELVATAGQRHPFPANRCR